MHIMQKIAKIPYKYILFKKKFRQIFCILFTSKCNNDHNGHGKNIEEY